MLEQECLQTDMTAADVPGRDSALLNSTKNSMTREDKGKQSMKSKHLQFIASLALASLIAGGCARVAIEEEPTPVATAHEHAAEATESHQAGVSAQSAEEDASVEAVVVEAHDSAAETAIHAETTDEAATAASADPATEADTHHEVLAEGDPHDTSSEVIYVVENTDEHDGELGSLDSTSYLRLVRPNDYLGKIAQREYNDPNKWRNIYQWNRELIGDNPNTINPYLELVLFKPEAEIDGWSYDYFIHSVEQGETLWTIAGDRYGDNLAWIVIYADNEELLSTNGAGLALGTELRIRTSLFGPDTNEHDIYSTVEH